MFHNNRKNTAYRHRGFSPGRYLLAAICGLIVMGLVICGTVLFRRFLQNRKDDNLSVLVQELGILDLGPEFTSQKILSEKDAIKAALELGERSGYTNAMEGLTAESVNTWNGITWYRLNENYKGIPVYGRGLVITADESGNPLSANGNVVDILDLSLKPEVSLETAVTSISQYIESENFWENTGLTEEQFDEIELGLTELSSDDLVIYAKDGTSLLAYNLSLYDQNCQLVLDALTGEVLEVNSTWDGCSFISADAQRKFQNPDSGETPETASEEYTRIPKVPAEPHTGTLLGQREVYENITFSRKGQASGDYTFYLCDYKRNIAAIEPQWKASNPGQIIEWNNTLQAPDPAIVDAYVNSQKAYDYFQNTFTWAPYLTLKLEYNNRDSEAREKIACTHSDKYEFKTVYTKRLLDKYCISTYPDVAVHEYCHGVIFFSTSITAKEGETAAIKEALCDIFGQLFEMRYTGATDWIFGGVNWAKHRNLADPSKTNGASTASMAAQSTNFYEKSTVISHAAYLMNRDSGFDYPDALELDQMESLWFGTLWMLPCDCSFSEFRVIMERMACTMLSQGQLNHVQYLRVLSAFDEVGVEPAPRVGLTLNSGAHLYVMDINEVLCDNYHMTLNRIHANVGQRPGTDLESSLPLLIQETEIINETINSPDGPYTFNQRNGSYKLILTDGNDQKRKLEYLITVNDNGQLRYTIFTNFNTYQDTAEPDNNSHLRQQLEAAVNSTCLEFLSRDFDHNGSVEAFGLFGTRNGDVCEDVSLWYIDSSGFTSCQFQGSRGYFGGLAEAKERYFVVWESEDLDSVGKSVIWGVKGNIPYELKISGECGMFQRGEDEGDQPRYFGYRKKENSDRYIRSDYGFNEQSLEFVNLYYLYIRDELVPQMGFADTQPTSMTLTPETATSHFAWDTRSGLLSANIEDFDGDTMEDLLVFYFDHSTQDYWNGVNPPALYVSLYSKNESEIFHVNTLELGSFLATGYDLFQTGIMDIGDNSFLYTEANSNAYFADGYDVDYTWYGYDGNELRPYWLVGKTDGGSSDIVYSLLTYSDAQNYDKYVLWDQTKGGWDSRNETLATGFSLMGLPSPVTADYDGVTYPTYWGTENLKESFQYICLGEGSYSNRNMHVTVSDATKLKEIIEGTE